MSAQQTRSLTLFLCGDVMTGRGIDQVLPHPGDPTLYESYVRNARDYVELAERLHGRIHPPVNFEYIWGDALSELRRAGVDLRIINLETSVTTSDACWHRKPIHYRMHPLNIGCLSVAGIHACALANNHVLDWGYPGLQETLYTLDQAGISHAGAGCDAIGAEAPAILEVPGKGRVLLFSFGSPTSGVPMEWRATNQRPGVNLLEDLSEATAERIAARMRQFQQPGDLLIASIHWGDNWGYDIPGAQMTFARCLVEDGVAIVHGHSSRHVKSLEVYQGRLILYGCGDFLTDYEGITGYEAFRGDLALMYLVQMDAQEGRLLSARLVPLQSRRFRLQHASTADVRWLSRLLNELGEGFGTQVELARDNSMKPLWR